MGPRRRALLSAVLAATALVSPACGGGSPSGTDQPASPAGPGASVDPNANGTYTGPINKAKQLGPESDARTQQMEEQGTEP